MSFEGRACKPIAADLFDPSEDPTLWGGRHRATGRIVFPMPAGMEAADYEQVPLAREGTLWSWTIQQFRPKSPPYTGPEDFEPYAVGYVELPGEVIVETRLAHVSFDEIRIGDPYRLTIIPFGLHNEGTEIVTFAFEPVNGERA